MNTLDHAIGRLLDHETQAAHRLDRLVMSMDWLDTLLALVDGANWRWWRWLYSVVGLLLIAVFVYFLFS